MRNQKNCGACWAISAIEVIESVYAIKTGSLQTFSVQQVRNFNWYGSKMVNISKRSNFRFDKKKICSFQRCLRS